MGPVVPTGKPPVPDPGDQTVKGAFLMSSPQHHSLGTHPLPGVAPAETAPQEAPGSCLRILPMDPHRIFVYWRLSDNLVEEAQCTIGRGSVPDDLLLRIFQMKGLTESLSRARVTETFPINRRRRETRLHLSHPGGYVVGVLGAQDRHGRFFPMLRSARVALPEAPASPDAPERAPLDKAAVLHRASLNGLPPELLRLPGKYREHPSPARATELRALRALCQTPALDEQQVVERVLTHTAAPSPDLEHPAGPTPKNESQPAGASRTAPSSHSLAGGAAHESGAPLALRAILVTEGFTQPDEELIVAGVVGKPGPDGRCTWTLPCEDFATAWTVLKERPAAAADTAVDAGPSFTLEIEGVVRDKTYLARLPRGIAVDAAGCFRVARPLPRDHALVPEWSLRRKISSLPDSGGRPKSDKLPGRLKRHQSV